MLREGGNYHRGISPSNLRFYRTSCGRVIGVLNDYDLSFSQNDCPRGNERILGTVPFMPTDLLTPSALESKVEHVYRYDVESFAWVFVWVCLQYRDGKLRQKRRPLDQWLALKVDALMCSMLKSHFLMLMCHEHKTRPSSSHRDNWVLAQTLLDSVGLFYAVATDDDDVVFQMWLKDPVESLTTV
ncbi:hypothetical protein BDR03DRAFT_506630 [Suillus americanus]|nr:hypothetical protein BDR03DRAFT_506630 [Suillus americanus]